jgi:steroid delta-isomerase-like uncharacterized protein
MSAKENCDLAMEIFRRFNGGELNEAVALSTDDVEVQLLSMGQAFHGHDGFMQFMQGFKDAFPDIRVTIENQVADDDRVVSECSWTGTHNGPLHAPDGDIPATGNAVVGARFCEVWTIREGKLAKLVNYQDAGTWLRQLGLVP